MKRILFLDIDGCLNTESFLWGVLSRTTHTDEDMIDPFHVEQLNRIVRETDCDVVLSSAWRVDGIDKVQGWLKLRGFEYKLLDVTPGPLGYANRTEEILAWLANNKASNFCVVDDCPMGEVLREHFVWCDPNTGLTPARASLAIEILSRKEMALWTIC